MVRDNVESNSDHEYFAHSSALIDGQCSIGRGTTIAHFSHIMAGAVIGASCSLGNNVFVSSEARVGNKVRIANNVSICDRVVLEDEVVCGASIVFTEDEITGRRRVGSSSSRAPGTLVCYGAKLGANATIMYAVTVGRFAVVTAGSVVTADVPAFALVSGNPARIGGYVCECARRLLFDARGDSFCNLCGKSYRKRGHSITDAATC